jgi:hypothetical protein
MPRRRAGKVSRGALEGQLDKSFISRLGLPNRDQFLNLGGGFSASLSVGSPEILCRGWASTTKMSSSRIRLVGVHSCTMPCSGQTSLSLKHVGCCAGR